MLKIENLSAAYGEKNILQDVTLDVPAGRMMILLGPNGAGKSTLLRTVSGVLAPRRGRVLWQGVDVLRLKAAARARLLAVVPQRPVLPPGFTVQQAVMMGRTPYLNFLGRPERRDEAAVTAALTRVGLDGLAERRVDELSGGEQQRVLLARGLAQETPILLLDEPVTHLDLYHQMQLLTLLRDVSRERGLTVLMVLHDLNLALRFADRVALLQDGRLLAEGEPPDVLTPERISALYGWPVSRHRLADGMIFVPQTGFYREDLASALQIPQNV